MLQRLRTGVGSLHPNYDSSLRFPHPRVRLFVTILRFLTQSFTHQKPRLRAMPCHVTCGILFLSAFRGLRFVLFPCGCAALGPLAAVGGCQSVCAGPYLLVPLANVCASYSPPAHTVLHLLCGLVALGVRKQAATNHGGKRATAARQPQCRQSRMRPISTQTLCAQDRRRIHTKEQSRNQRGN